MRSSRSLVNVGWCLAVAACAGANQGGPGSSSHTCSAKPPSESRPYSLANAAALAGTYDLQLVVTAGSRDDDVGPYRLVLGANDSAQRYAHAGKVVTIGHERGQRPLVGYLEGRDTKDSVVESQDANRLGVTVIDSVLRVGTVDVVDGGGDNLAIVAVSAAGFWGHWERDRGIELDPHPTRGHFCAVRVE